MSTNNSGSEAEMERTNVESETNASNPRSSETSREGSNNIPSFECPSQLMKQFAKGPFQIKKTSSSIFH